MALIDKDLKIAAAQAVTASAASTDYLDLGAAGDALAHPMTLVVRCHTTADSSTDAAVVTVSLQTDDNTSFSTPKTLAASGGLAIGSAQLTANAVTYSVKLPAGCERYVRVYFAAATENLSAGKFDAYFVMDKDQK